MLTEEQLTNTPFTCDISNKEYHASPGLSNSGINILMDCPLKYWDQYLNPNKPEKKETPSQRWGNMVHCYILEPEEFYKRYVVGPDLSKNTKEYKAFKAENAGREVIDSDEEEALKGISKSISEHKTARILLKGGRAEQSIYFKDKQTGILLKTRPDYMTSDYIVDLKTTNCASEAEFSKSIANYNYHRQAAIGLDGFEAISGIRHTNFFNLCIEPGRPYIVSPFLMEDDAINQGRGEYQHGLRLYRQCMEANEWPPYVPEFKPISLPNWAKK